MAQKKYVVKPTDNPLTLAKKFGVPASKLLQANGLVSLTPGQTLKVPNLGAKGSLGTSTSIHTGENNNYTTTINGATVRVPSNTVFQTQQPQAPSALDFIKNLLTGNSTDNTPSNLTGVRGALPGEAQKVAFSPAASVFGGGGVNPLGATGSAVGVNPTNRFVPLGQDYNPQYAFQTPAQGTGNTFQPTQQVGFRTPAQGTGNGVPVGSSGTFQTGAGTPNTNTQGSGKGGGGGDPVLFYSGSNQVGFNTLREARQYQMRMRMNNQQAEAASVVTPIPQAQLVNSSLSWRVG